MIGRLIERSKGALLAMHLCGALSVRAIEAFKALATVEVIVLCPCCLPGSKTDRQ
jgi:hypothetical protein